MHNRRVLLLGVLAGAAVPLAGCMNKPLRPVNPDGTYCFSIGKPTWRRLTCTTEPVPSLEAEVRAKRFEALPGALTLYVVRHRWGDTANQVSVAIDEHSGINTIPVSLLRFRLSPGRHRLVLVWEGRGVEHYVDGAAGEVQFVELVGSVWSWRSSYSWEGGSGSRTMARASTAKLIADVDLAR